MGGPGASWELCGLLEQRLLVAGVPVPSDPSPPRTKACPQGSELESRRAATWLGTEGECGRD